ncbi:MAG: hypothetical protein ACHQ6T_18415 [Myxococcota bacterium]
MTGRTYAVALAIGAALSTSATSRATTVTYDLSGISSYRIATTLAPPIGYVEIPAAPGSSLTLDLDANGDGNSGDVTVVDAAMLIKGDLIDPAWLSTYGSVDADFVLRLSGGLGQASFPDLYVQWSTPASYVVGGNVTCSGPICGVFGWQPGTPHTYADLLADGAGLTAPTSLALGVWNLGNGGQTFSYCAPSLDTEFGCRNLLVTSRVPSGAWVDAIVLAGVAIPEPAPFLLLAPALLALALRSRASGTMRRHEAH